MLHIKKNDEVLVISGKDKGSRGKVLSVFPQRNRVIVENVNFIKRHTRPNPQQNIQGGVVERESPIHLSNLMLICPECREPSRVGFSRLSKGEKVRECKKCKATIGNS